MRHVPRGVVFLLFCLGCSAEEPIGQSTGAVVNGTPVDDMDATVRLNNVWGGLCSGSLIAPQVVMTAKHCLDDGAFGWLIGIGPTGSDRSVDIDDVLLTEDMGGEVFQNEDIAFAILETPIDDIPPYPMPWGGDDLHEGEDARLLGYGGTEEGTVGRKYETTDRVAGVGDFEFITSGNGVCGGDSGGTALDSDGVVVGVIVRGPVAECEIMPGRSTALTRVSTWLDLAREAFDRTGACYPTGEEACDGRDNDCNGTVDDGCDPIGAPCTIAENCSSETCEVVDGERVCTDRCDARIPDGGCGEGAYCRELACGEGWCVPGAAGEGEAGDACDVQTDCASLVCAGGVCAERCTVGVGACAPGEVCWSDGGCSAGGCIEESLAPDAPRGLGETCRKDGDCTSGDCLATDLGRYCTSRCEGDATACPAGWHCEDDLCRRGDPGEAGDPCRVDVECASRTCAHWEEGSACTEPCEDGVCPDGLDCVDAGGSRVCEPEERPTGQACQENDDCLRGVCGQFEVGRYCTEICDEASPCPPGFDCVQTTSDVRVCAKPGVLAAGGGCAVAGAGDASALWAIVLVPLAMRRRRRT